VWATPRGGLHCVGEQRGIRPFEARINLQGEKGEILRLLDPLLLNTTLGKQKGKNLVKEDQRGESETLVANHGTCGSARLKETVSECV